MNETVVSNWDATNNWGCGVLAAPEFSWNYLANSDLKSSLAYPNGLTASWTYGNRGELLEVNNALADGSISKYAYTYDAAGRRVACAKSGTAFEQSDSVNYGYNARSELTNATAAVDTAYRYGYNFDDIGNRKSSAERGVWSSEYTANSLNQYTTITSQTARASEAFRNYYDVDGNQIRVKTATGTWQVSYNGENRPVRWQQGPTVITMSFDRMGRRVTKNDQRFVYNGYLQIANFHSTTTTSDYNYFVWDCTENVATRPLAWTTPTTNHESPITRFYTHDGNKNVSEVIAFGTDVAAHYEYAPFGALTVSRGASAAANPWRFSSEYAEDDTATVYYNYRHYEPVTGRWMQRDPIEEKGGIDVYGWCGNNGLMRADHLGRKFIKPDKSGECPIKCCNKKRVRLVPVWSCKRTLKWTDSTATGSTSWYHRITALYHQYLCCNGPTLGCYGVHAGSKKGDTIPSEPEPTGKCKKLCVCPEEKKMACSGCAKMPEDYHIGPHGTDCQEWVDEVTSSEAE